MEKYRIKSIEQLTPELILSLVNRYKLKEVPRLKRLKRYYDNKSDIKQRTMIDKSKPNHKLATPFANYITSSITGYFIGKPVSYQSNNEDLMLQLQDVFDSNEEQFHNSKIAQDQSIYGIGYELTYLDEQGHLRFSVLNPEETFLVYDTSINSKPIVAIRFYEIQEYTTETTELFVEVYTSDSILHYNQQNEDELSLFAEEIHYFKSVPVIAYENSSDRFGDFERVMDLIDAFDLTISDQQNSLEYFADAYLLIQGMDMNQEDIAKMKENRVMLVDKDGNASFLTKGTESLGLSEYQNKLQENIHTFSFVPDMSDEKFSNASGESLRYKLLSLENAVSIKERSFKQALEERIKLIVNHFNLKGHSYNANDVVMSFKRNMPTNNKDIVEMVSKLKGLLSDVSLLQLLPWVEDANYELDLLKKQNEDSINEFGTYNLTQQ